MDRFSKFDRFALQGEIYQPIHNGEYQDKPIRDPSSQIRSKSTSAWRVPSPED